MVDQNFVNDILSFIRIAVILHQAVSANKPYSH